MVLGWRRAFCTSTPKDHDPKIPTTINTHRISNPTTPAAAATTSTGRSPRLGSRFNFFSSSATATPTSNPSPPPPASTSRSPILRCRTAEIIDATTTTSPLAPSPSTASTPPPRTDHANGGSNSNNTKNDNFSSTPPTTLRCRIPKTSRTLFNRCSNHSSPAAVARSPSTFSLIKSNLGLSSSSSKSNKSSSTSVNRGGICSKPSNRPPVFNTDCSNKDPPLLPTSNQETSNTRIRTYNDDEPLSSPTAGARFNPIPESDENCNEDDEIINHQSSSDFPGFHTTTPRPLPNLEPIRLKGLEVKISQEAAVIAVSRSYQTYTAVLKVKTPPVTLNSPGRAPIDLVVVIDVAAAVTSSEMLQQSSSVQLQAVKRVMRVVISSLTSNDRLSIVAFSATSKRLLPLTRMTLPGRRSARRIVEALIVPARVGGASTSCANDALRKAAKVLQDRQQKNPFTTLLLLSSAHDDHNSSSTDCSSTNRYPVLSSTSYSNTGIPLHFLTLCGSSSSQSSSDEAVSKCVKRLINVVVSDLSLQLGFAPGSAAGEISAAYSYNGRPTSLSPGLPKLGHLYAEEEREILLELRVPASAVGSHHILTVRSLHADLVNKETIYGKEQFITVPRPHTVRSLDPKIQQLRTLFMVTRAVAESRRLAERADLGGAYHLLTSTRALLVAQPSTSMSSTDEFRRMVDAEIVLVEQGRKVQVQAMAHQRQQRRWNAVAGAVGSVCVDEKGDPLTPTSAWKAAEKLAKVAIMRKSMNRVSDLHGFENARF